MIGYHKMRLMVDGKSAWILQVKRVPKSSGICFRRRVPYYLTVPIETQYTVVALNNMLTSGHMVLFLYALLSRHFRLSPGTKVLVS
jgi:hypothetical protein